MKYRTLLNGQKVAESPISVQMTIDSKCPKKWAFVDLETGDIWVHHSRFPSSYTKQNKYTFYGIDYKAFKCLKDLVNSDRFIERYDE